MGQREVLGEEIPKTGHWGSGFQEQESHSEVSSSIQSLNVRSHDQIVQRDFSFTCDSSIAILLRTQLTQAQILDSDAIACDPLVKQD